MSFLPLARRVGAGDDGTVHPYVVDRLVQERREELVRLSQADRRAREMRTSRAPVRSWRRRAGRAIVALGVAVAVPPAHRGNALRQAATVLGLERP